MLSELVVRDMALEGRTIEKGNRNGKEKIDTGKGRKSYPRVESSNLERGTDKFNCHVRCHSVKSFKSSIEHSD